MVVPVAQQSILLYELSNADVAGQASLKFALGGFVRNQGTLVYGLNAPVAGQINAGYSMTLAIAGQVDAGYSMTVSAGSELRLLYTIRIGGQVATPYAHRLGGQVNCGYTGLVFVAGQVAGAYALTQKTPVAGQVAARYNVLVGRQTALPFALTLTVAGQVAAPYTASVSVAGQVAEPYALAPLNRVVSGIAIIYAMPAFATFHTTDAPKIIFNSQPVRLVTFSVRTSEGAFAWTLTARLSDPVDFVAMSVDDPFTLDVYGESYEFIVDSKSVDRSGPANVQLQISGISPTASASLPRAKKITKTWGQVMARTAAEEALGEGIDWRIDDWPIPANRLAVTDAAPVDVARQIVQSAGGVLETKKDGSWLARPAYPVTVPDWGTATPDHTLTDEVDNLSVSELYRRRDLFNAVTIRDFNSGPGATRDRTEYIADTADPLKGVLRVYAWPWRPVEVAHTGHPAVGLAPRGLEYASKRELVEFIAGKASVQYPVYSVTSVQWQYADLGAVTANGTDLTADGAGGYSLAWVTYQARAYVFNVSDTIDETIQFLVMDNVI